MEESVPRSTFRLYSCLLLILVSMYCISGRLVGTESNAVGTVTCDWYVILDTAIDRKSSQAYENHSTTPQLAPRCKQNPTKYWRDVILLAIQKANSSCSTCTQANAPISQALLSNREHFAYYHQYDTPVYKSGDQLLFYFLHIYDEDAYASFH